MAADLMAAGKGACKRQRILQNQIGALSLEALVGALLKYNDPVSGKALARHVITFVPEYNLAPVRGTSSHVH